MSTKPSAALTAHFKKAMQLMEAERGDYGYYRGILECAPFLAEIDCEQTVAVYAFKFRTQDRVQLDSYWADRLADMEFAVLEVTSSIEAGYVYLNIANPRKVEPAAIVRLARKCVTDHARLFPSDEGTCYRCREQGNGRLVQTGATISTLCGKCHEKTAGDAASRLKTHNPVRPVHLIFLPAALAISAIAWFGLWMMFDSALGASDQEVKLPVKITLFIAVLLGLVVGWPVGKLLQNSGIAYLIPKWLVTSISCLLTALLGEATYAGYLINQMEDPVTLLAVPFLMIGMIVSSSWFYVLIKICFVFGVGISISNLISGKDLLTEEL